MKRELRSSQYFLNLNIITAAQAAVLVIFTIVVYVLRDPERSIDPEERSLYQYLTLGLLIAGVVASQIVPKQLIRGLNRSLPLRHKVPKYSMLVITRLACLELPGLFACTGAFITGEITYLFAVPLLLVMFYVYRPTKEGLAADLNLTSEEKRLLEDPNAIIAEVEYSETE